MRFLANQTAVQALKDDMGYTPATARCDTCEHFKIECSGPYAVFPSHCELNPAAFFPVEKDSGCKYHKPKPPSEEVVETAADH